MKIAIIGGGTSGVITALRMFENGHEVNIYVDPNKSALNVGESTTPTIGAVILRNLKLSIQDMATMGIASIKTGVKFVDWGVGNSFIHGFKNQIAFHFESVPFSETLSSNLKQIGITYIYENVAGHKEGEYSVTINDREYDFVVYCTGWSDEDSYSPPMFSSVNSAILFQQDFLDKDQTCTLHNATDDGWMFGLPFPERGITKRGYLYDKDLPLSSELEKRLANNDYARQISWTPRVSDVLVQSKRVAYNGNRLFFLEPLQALSLHFYDYFAWQICQYLFDFSDRSRGFANKQYNITMMEYQLSIAYHYSFGSTKETKFWKDIQEKATNLLNLVSPYGKRKLFQNLIETDEQYRSESLHLSGMGSFEYDDLNCLHQGFTGKKLFTD